MLRTPKWTQSYATSDAVKKYKYHNHVYIMAICKVHGMAILPSQQIVRHSRQLQIVQTKCLHFFFFLFFWVQNGGVIGSRKWRKIQEFPTQTSMNTLVVFHFTDISKNIKLNSACIKTINWPPMQLLKKPKHTFEQPKRKK